jgi:hypothetical protein
VQWRRNLQESHALIALVGGDRNRHGQHLTVVSAIDTSRTSV